MKTVIALCKILLVSVNLIMVGSVTATEEAPTEGLNLPVYVPVKPAFVVNYGGPGKLQYLKVEVSLRVEDTNASNAARHHMPLIRDYLVKKLSRQTNEDLETPEGKERLRVAALEGIQNILMEEDGAQGITNLFFNSFVMQR